MHPVTVRELRNTGGEVLARVVRGESITVTKDGVPVAELMPLRRRSARTSELIARRRSLPRVDSSALRHDIDSVMDSSL